MNIEQLTLLSKMNVEWNANAYVGAPGINIKRPYGNSGVLEDVVDILGWSLNRSEDLSVTQKANALLIHKSTGEALQELLRSLGNPAVQEALNAVGVYKPTPEDPRMHDARNAARYLAPDLDEEKAAKKLLVALEGLRNECTEGC